MKFTKKSLQIMATMLVFATIMSSCGRPGKGCPYEFSIVESAINTCSTVLNLLINIF